MCIAGKYEEPTNRSKKRGKNEWNRQTNWWTNRQTNRTKEIHSTDIWCKAFQRMLCCFAEPKDWCDMSYELNLCGEWTRTLHMIFVNKKAMSETNTNTHSELYTMRTMEYKFHLESMRRCIQWDKEFDILQWINELMNYIEVGVEKVLRHLFKTHFNCIICDHVRSIDWLIDNSPLIRMTNRRTAQSSEITTKLTQWVNTHSATDLSEYNFRCDSQSEFHTHLLLYHKFNWPSH